MLRIVSVIQSSFKQMGFGQRLQHSVLRLVLFVCLLLKEGLGHIFFHFLWVSCLQGQCCSVQ